LFNTRESEQQESRNIMFTEPVESALSRRAFLQVGTAGLAASAFTTRRATAENTGSGLTEINVTLVDRDAIGYGTFQNHNQKVVQNDHGIFMTHIRSRNAKYTAQQWRLSRSTDGGKTFSTVYEATHATNPPVLETDGEGRLYLARPDFKDGNAYLYRFDAPDYTDPEITTIPGAAAGKYSMLLDPERKQLYFFAHNNTFHIVGLDGEVRSSRTLTRGGKHAVIQYPHLALAADGTLHAPWITQQRGRYCYRTVQHVQSPDGGVTWQRMDGTSLMPPVVADETGPSQQISLDDELDDHSWLCSCVPKRDKVHFVYSTIDASKKYPEPSFIRLNYVRCDAETGKKDFHRQGEFRGHRIRLNKWNGFMASRSSDPNAPLYCIMADDERLACLASHDNGQTWSDHAIGETQFTDTYSIGGFREVTSDGHILGTFTDRVQSPLDPKGICPVYFFKIKVGVRQNDSQ